MSDDELAIDSGALIFATLADVYLSSGMVDEAISILKDGLSRNPTYTLAKIILGRAYYMKSDIDEAIKLLEEAIKEAKDSENANLYLGHCYRKKGEFEKATQHYESVLKLNPQHAEARQELDALKPAATSSAQDELPEKEVPKDEVISTVETTEAPAVMPTDEPPSQPIETQKVSPEVQPEGDGPITEATEQPPESTADEQQEPSMPHMSASPPVVDAVAIGEPIQQESKPEEPAPDETDQSIAEQVDEPLLQEAPAPAAEASDTQITEPTKEASLQSPEVIEQDTVVTEEKIPPIEIEKEPPVEVTEATEIPFATLQKPVERLLNLKTVKGAIICSNDGLLIQNYYQESTEIEEICAMIAAIHNEAEESFKFLKEGSVEKFIIEKENETICVITAGESLLTVITKKETKPGLIFVYAKKIIDEIREILG